MCALLLCTEARGKVILILGTTTKVSGVGVFPLGRHTRRLSCTTPSSALQAAFRIQRRAMEDDDQEYSYEEADTADYDDEQEYYSEASPLPRSGARDDDDDDDDGGGSRPGPLGLKSIKVPDGGYIITSFAEIVPYRDALVSEVSALLDLDFDCVLVLLQHFGWAKEKLLDAVFSGRQAEVMAECGLDLYDAGLGRRLQGLRLWQADEQEGKGEGKGEGKDEGKDEGKRAGNAEGKGADRAEGKAEGKEGRDAKSASLSSPSSSASSAPSPSSSAAAAGAASPAAEKAPPSTATAEAAATPFSPMNQAQCRICYDHDPSDASLSLALGCGHSFHAECYRGYLESELGVGPACTLAHCPEVKCRQRVPSSLWRALLPPHAYAQFDLYLSRSFIEESKTLRYCPSPGCDRVAVGSAVSTVKCTACLAPFCFRCGEEGHELVSCVQLGVWALKCQNESETANWILVNTKKCPKCQTRIEKNQGCNHITCTKCRHDFCWICNGSWAEHGSDTGGFYKCNKFDPDKGESGASAASKAKRELDRYLHYYQRYHGHSVALKYAAGERHRTDKRAAEMQEGRSGWVDTEFLTQAIEQIIECRRVLKCSYVLGYFLEDGSAQKQLFEHQQEMLEKNTETLHRCAEVTSALGGLEGMAAADKAQIVNLTRVTDRFLRSVLEEFEGGLCRTEFGSVGAEGAEGRGAQGRDGLVAGGAAAGWQN